MGYITQWIEDRRNGQPSGMSREAEELLGRKLFDDLTRRLGPFITARVGMPTSEEMATLQFAHLLKRLDDGELGMPQFITNSKTLFLWLYRAAWSRLSDLHDRNVKHGTTPEDGVPKKPALPGSGHGALSATPRDEDGAVSPLGMDRITERPHRGDLLDLEELPMEETEFLKAALSDARIWFLVDAGVESMPSPVKDWAYAFEQVIFANRDRGEVAEELDIAEGIRLLRTSCRSRIQNHLSPSARLG